LKGCPGELKYAPEKVEGIEVFLLHLIPPSEKALVTRAIRDALDEAGFPNVPVIYGAAELCRKKY